MKHLSSISLVLFLFLSAFSLRAQTAADEKALRALVDEGIAANYAADVERLTAFFTDDAIMIPYTGVKFIGKEAIRQAMTEWLKQDKPEPGSINYTVSTIRLLSADLALVVIDMSGKSKMGDQTIEWQAIETLLCKRQNGKWLVALDQSTPLMPMPGAEESK